NRPWRILSRMSPTMRNAARRLRSFHSISSTGRIRLPRYQISSRIFPLCSATPPEADFRPTVRTPEDQQVYARQVRVDIRDLPPMLQSRSFERPPSPRI